MLRLGRRSFGRRSAMGLGVAGAFTVALLVPVWASGARRPASVDDLMGLRSLVEVTLSPDGRRVAYVVSEASFEKDAHEAAVYVVAATGGTPRRLTHATRIFNRPLPRPRLRWTPDGSSLSFLAWAGEVPQVVVMKAGEGGEPRTVTSAKGSVGDYEWSPDGSRIAYIAPDPVPEDEERRRKERTFVLEVDRHERPPRVWVQEASGGASRAVTPPAQFVSGLSWSPDGATIAYSASLRGGFPGQFHTRIYAVAASGGEPRPVVDRPGMNTSPKFSPDGRFVAFISTGGRPEMISTWGLHVAAAAGPSAGPIRNLSGDSWVQQFVWAPDSRSVVVVPSEGTALHRERMFEQPIRRLWLDGRTEDLVQGPTVNFSPSLSEDGRLLAYETVEARTMGDVELRDLATRRVTRLTDLNPQLKELDLGELKPIRWTSFDGMEIWGLLLLPPGYRPGERLPLLVYCHGGPIGGFTYGVFPQFMHTVGQVDPYPTAAMAGAGIAVFFPMPRGGSGYGEEGFRMIKDGWGVGDYKDIMAGIDHRVSQGIADPERLGVMGGSYGGYLTNWIVTQTDRFKAASTMCSVSDIADLYYLSDAGDFTAEYFGLPWEKPEAYAAHSPVTHASRVRTPLLIQHGEEDRRVPLMQATKFYKALKEQGKTVEMEIYPRGGHVMYEPDLQREMMRRNLAWFVKWLAPRRPAHTAPGGAPASSPAASR